MIEELQVAWEIEQLVDLARDYCNSILEVGVWKGGTLRRWLEIADTVVAIDNNPDSTGNEFAGANFIRGDSGDPEIIALAEALGPYDLVWVDADHSEPAGRRDFENYWPLVREGGMYAMHDIRRTGGSQLDVVWNDIRLMGHPTAEFQHRVEEWGGIGVIWK